MGRIDYHIHSDFSFDSQERMENYIKKAIQENYTSIAFTDHFEFLSSEISYCGIPSLKDYKNKIQNLKEKYSELEIIFGVEIGEYHKTPKRADELFNIIKPDLKVASVHIADGKYISIPFKSELKSQLIHNYYLENLKLSQIGNFDILGHLGIYKRYLDYSPDESDFKEIKAEIFKNIIKQHIALEINTSSLNKSYQNLLLSKSDLQLYQDLGGKLITLGSDSHNLELFNKNYNKAVRILKSAGMPYISEFKEGNWLKREI